MRPGADREQRRGEGGLLSPWGARLQVSAPSARGLRAWCSRGLPGTCPLGLAFWLRVPASIYYL